MSQSRYDATYFDWQRETGKFGGWANLSIFGPYIKPTDTVLDFGCGGGYLLANLECARRIGVEINHSARRVAKESGVEVYPAAAEVPRGCVDVVISFHALEHAHHPLDELRALRETLKPGGRIIILVPCETLAWRYRPNDVNMHLYSWGPMTMGNLLTEAGFRVLESTGFRHQWPPRSRYYARYLGRPLFEVACYAYGRVSRLWHHVKAVAEKPHPVT